MAYLFKLCMSSTLGVAPPPDLPPLSEPFPLLHGQNPTGSPKIATSPDPLVSMTWNSTTNITALQRFVFSFFFRGLTSSERAFCGLCLHTFRFWTWHCTDMKFSCRLRGLQPRRLPSLDLKLSALAPLMSLS